MKQGRADSDFTTPQEKIAFVICGGEREKSFARGAETI
jgi:hypothetical protein